MRYVGCKIEEDFERHAYRIYISDGLYSIAGNYKDRYANMIDIKALREKAAQEQKSGDEIVQEVMVNAGLKFGETP